MLDGRVHCLHEVYVHVLLVAVEVAGLERFVGELDHRFHGGFECLPLLLLDEVVDVELPLQTDSWLGYYYLGHLLQVQISEFPHLFLNHFALLLECE